MQSNDSNRPLAKPIWIDRFGTRLTELRSGMNAVTAAQLAVASYSDASELAPEEAAEIFATVWPVGEVGAGCRVG